MSKEKLQFAVSSMSTGECRPSHIHQILVPRFATEQMVRRTTHLKDMLEPVFGKGNVSISLHPATTIDVPKIIGLLRKEGIPVSSIDVPSVYTNQSCTLKMLKGLIAINPKESLIQLGWRLQNVGSEKKKAEKLDQAYQALKGSSSTENPYIFRTNAEIWHESREGDDLRRSLRDLPKTIIAIEIDAKTQTPDDYIRFLQKLAVTNDKDTPVYADLDLGHFGESKHLHGKKSEIPEPLEVLSRILADKETSKLVALTSLNQYTPGDTHTHSNFMNGPIDFMEAAKKLGIAVRESKLQFPAMIVAEFFPMEYEEVISNQAIKQWRKIREAFDSKE